MLKKRQKKRALRARFFAFKRIESLFVGVLLLHLLLDEITNGGRTGSFSGLAAHAFEGLLVVFNVLGLDGQVAWLRPIGLPKGIDMRDYDGIRPRNQIFLRFPK